MLRYSFATFKFWTEKTETLQMSQPNENWLSHSTKKKNEIKLMTMSN